MQKVKHFVSESNFYVSIGILAMLIGIALSVGRVLEKVDSLAKIVPQFDELNRRVSALEFSNDYVKTQLYSLTEMHKPKLNN